MILKDECSLENRWINFSILFCCCSNSYNWICPSSRPINICCSLLLLFFERKSNDVIEKPTFLDDLKFLIFKNKKLIMSSFRLHRPFYISQCDSYVILWPLFVTKSGHSITIRTLMSVHYVGKSYEKYHRVITVSHTAMNRSKNKKYDLVFKNKTSSYSFE